ncbi:toxin VasX [Bacteroides fragilis]|uniref:toxin VasX n=1 Tax=Bacteroides fragilis TaxID=817 RepID=UPI00356674A8
MKDDMIAIFGLKASGKGKEAQGNNLYAVDYVRLYLSLYGVYSKSTHKSGILAPLEGNDVSSFPAPKGFPDMKYGYSYQRIPLRKGYIYAYFEKHNTAGIFKEYEVTNEGGIVNLVWSDMENPRISWETPKKDRMTNYIVLRKQYDKKVWLVLSPIRWSKQYAEKVLGNEEERNKRMQSLECETCFKGEYDNHGFAVEEAKSILVSPPWDYLTEFSDKVKAGNYLEWENASYKAYFDRYKGQYEKNCALKKGDADNHDFYFSLFDPQGIADILCADIAIETRNLLVMVESMKTGDITKAYKKVDANALDGNYDNPELVALIDMGILLYRMSDVKTGVFTKYKSHISTDLLKTILLVEPRAKLRQKIHYIRELLSEIIMCEAYQLSIQDYLVEKMPTVNKGKSSLSKHLSGLANAPEKIDGYLDQPIGHSKNLSVTEKKIGNCINNVLSSESNTGKLLRKEWNLDEIVDSVSLITDTQDSVGDIADALLGYIRYIRANQKLNFISEVFRFVTKDGQIFVKIPEGMFTAELKNKIDFSHLRTTTLKGKGKGFLIKLSDVTDVDGNPISGSLSKFKRTNSSVSVSLDKLMPEWQKQLAKADNKGEKWAKGFKKFVDNPQFARAMIGITILKTSLTVKKEDKNIEDSLELIGSVLFLADLKQEYLARLAPALMKKIGRTLSITTVVALNAASTVDGIYLIKENQTAAGTIAIISGVSGGVGGVAIILGFSNPYTIALIILSLSSTIILEAIRDTSLQSLLKNCAYGNNYKLNAKSGIELLNKALKTEVRSDKLKSFLYEQQKTLNQLLYIEQHAIRTELTLYYSYKTINSYPHTIHESTELNYLEVTIRIWCMPLLDGEIEVYLYDIDGSDSNPPVESLFSETNIVQIDALQGVAVVRFEVEDPVNNTRKFRGGTLKIMVRIKNSEGQYLPTINGIPHGIASYFPYQNSFKTIVTEIKAGGQTRYNKKHKEIIKYDKLYTSPPADREELEIMEQKTKNNERS